MRPYGSGATQNARDLRRSLTLRAYPESSCVGNPMAYTLTLDLTVFGYGD